MSETPDDLAKSARRAAANLHSSGRWEIMELLLERLASEIEHLGKYVMHTNKCSGNDDFGQTCDCGLNGDAAP